MTESLTDTGTVGKQRFQDGLKSGTILSFPGRTSEQAPPYDAGGANSGFNQSGSVFFLVYSWDIDPANPAPNHRYATVPADTAILADLDGWSSYWVPPLHYSAQPGEITR